MVGGPRCFPPRRVLSRLAAGMVSGDGSGARELEAQAREAVTAIRREALLAVRNLKTYFPQDEGTVKAVDGVSFDLYPRRDPGHRGRERVRQERDGEVHHGHRRSAGQDRRRRDPVPPAGHRGRGGRRSGGRPCEAGAEWPGDAGDPRGRDRAHLPGADVVVQPGPHDREPDQRGDHAAPAGRPRAGPREDDRDAAAGRRVVAGRARGPALQSARAAACASGP